MSLLEPFQEFTKQISEVTAAYVIAAIDILQ